MKQAVFMLAFALLAVPSVSFAQKTTVTTMNRSVRYRTVEHSVSVWYQGELNAGYGVGGTLTDEDGDTEDAKYMRPFIETVHGVRITKYAFVGLGTGFQYAYHEYWKSLVIPTFLNLKGYYPVTDKFAPYFSMDLGYSGLVFVDAGDDVPDGGFYSSVGIGLNYRKLNFGLGWQNQKMKETYKQKDYSWKVGSFFAKIGLKF